VGRVMDNFIRYRVTENLAPELKLLDIWGEYFIKFPILPNEVWSQIKAIQNQTEESTEKTILFGGSEIVSATIIYQVGESVKIHDETYIVESLNPVLTNLYHFDMTVYKKDNYDKKCKEAKPLIVDILMAYRDKEVEKLIEQKRLGEASSFKKVGIFKSILNFFKRWNKC
jgi:hypothetical protein